MDTPITFIWPAMFVLLLLAPVFVVVYIRMQQRRRAQAAQFSNPAARPAQLSRWRRARRHIPPIIFLIALIVLIVALARPQTEVSLPQLEGTIVLVFDVSGSMAADDLKPTRLDA